MTQHEQILEYIAKHGSITSAEAYEEYGILRLASRIGELKNKGYVFNTETLTGKNRFGKPTNYAKYSLIDES